MNQPETTSGAVGRGVMLTILAVAIGFFLLARAFDDPSDTANNVTTAPSTSDQDTTDDPDNDTTDPSTDQATTTTTTTTQPPLVTHRPGEVKAVTINGTGGEHAQRCRDSDGDRH